jgi:glucose/arabinose dehydrogenase
MRASQAMLSAHTGTGCDARNVIRHRASAVALVVTIVACTLLTPLTGAGAATSRVSIGAGLRGPEGLTATAYAKKLKKLSALAVDAQGRIWAATAEATDENTDAVYLVAEAGAQPVKVVTDVHTPLGLLWVGDTLYVSEAGGIVALSGFDGTAFATRSTVLTVPDGTGELNGIAQGRDGRLYVGISAPCDHCTPTTQWSASVISLLPDGSDLQVVADGIRAPIGLAFFPGTDDLFVTMNQRDDLGTKTPGDWLAVVRAGQSWGFPSCYGQGGSTCTGVPSPVATLGKHSAASGVAILTGQLGATVGTGAAVAEWVTGKVKLVRLAATGAEYEGTTGSFLSGFENPVPVLVDATGALFVGDWTSGRLYRITT